MSDEPYSLFESELSIGGLLDAVQSQVDALRKELERLDESELGSDELSSALEMVIAAPLQYFIAALEQFHGPCSAWTDKSLPAEGVDSLINASLLKAVKGREIARKCEAEMRGQKADRPIPGYGTKDVN